MVASNFPRPVTVLAPIAWETDANVSIETIERDAKFLGVSVIYSLDMSTMILVGSMRAVMAVIVDMTEGGILRSTTPAEA